MALVSKRREERGDTRRCTGREAMRSRAGPAGNPIRGGKQGIDFCLLKVGHRWLNTPARGDALDLYGMFDQFGCLPCHESEQGMNGRESEIPCVDRIAALVLEMVQKALDHLGRELPDGDPSWIGRVAIGHEVKEQSQCVPIASLRVHTQISICNNLFEQERGRRAWTSMPSWYQPTRCTAMVCRLCRYRHKRHYADLRIMPTRFSDQLELTADSDRSAFQKSA
jgi:hypothetical protein